MSENVQHFHSFRFQHCDQVDHMIDKFFDIHHCQHYENHNHSSDICLTLKKPVRLKLATKYCTTSYIVYDRGEQYVRLQVSKPFHSDNKKS